MASQVIEDVPDEKMGPMNLHNDTANASPPKTDIKQQVDLEKSVNPPPPTSGPPPPPDGGLVAWLQVAAGFMLFFNTWGMISAFSVFQTYYESGELFEASSANISWIGSIQCFLLQITGLVAGPLYDRGYLRLLLVTGSFMVVFGHMMLSLCTEYWQALLAQAFCVGIGAGLLFVPIVSLIPTWFSTRIGLAVGIASSGSSLGGVIYSIVIYRLILQIGFPWAVRCVGFIALATFMVPLAVLRMRVRVPKPRAVVDWSAFRDAPFMVFTLGVLICFIGQTALIFYISFYPLDRGFTGTSLAFYSAAIFNAGSVLGRILPNALSDRIGVFNTMAPFTMLLGITMLSLLGVRNEAGMIVEAVVTGFFSGVVVALPPVCFRALTENKSMIGTRIGQGFAIGGFGLLAGGPGAGAVLGTTDPLDWTGLWIYGGVAACLAGLIYSFVRIMRSGFALNIKA
ncbi:monocarboxylate permease-like protein, mch4 [Melanomma pulvis-pyrius CBS 109.77]|uniref:Monocarboxylate permease-like protein, mch4 n=1 Tax=Melanomma pulvis-pyrius CBS 109.77 TaxID=1314802 RepID=A0A6A6XVG6_9PLEO|nr:monocarboxylate permease-like protein, mch4 [Melanomma pulvis-pyrius CBS 109.77]